MANFDIFGNCNHASFAAVVFSLTFDAVHPSSGVDEASVELRFLSS
jgi:hypothetical protein